jgi:hypothetical protein
MWRGFGGEGVGSLIWGVSERRKGGFSRRNRSNGERRLLGPQGWGGIASRLADLALVGALEWDCAVAPLA